MCHIRERWKSLLYDIEFQHVNPSKMSKITKSTRSTPPYGSKRRREKSSRQQQHRSSGLCVVAWTTFAHFSSLFFSFGRASVSMFRVWKSFFLLKREKFPPFDLSVVWVRNFSCVSSCTIESSWKIFFFISTSAADLWVSILFAPKTKLLIELLFQTV